MRMTEHYRSIIELSYMSNNDELVIYSRNQLNRKEHGERIKALSRSPFDQPRLIFSRPVFDIEIKAGLDVSKRSRNAFNEEVPDESLFLDALYRFKDYLERQVEISKLGKDPAKFLDPTELINEFVAQHYYDCMSGGMPKYLVSVIRHIMEHYSINWNTEVYPNKEEWYTLHDFYEETKDAPILVDTIKSLPISLPLLTGQEKENGTS